jgi:hypothetical protein
VTQATAPVKAGNGRKSSENMGISVKNPKLLAELHEVLAA